MRRLLIYSVPDLIFFVFSWELSCFWHIIHLSLFLWVVICALWCFWRQNWMCVCCWSGKIQPGAHCSLKKSLPVMISVLQFNTHAHKRTRAHTNTDVESDERLERGETAVEEKWWENCFHPVHSKQRRSRSERDCWGTDLWRGEDGQAEWRQND